MQSAEVLHNSDLIAFANSMLILAVEEEVKAHIIHGIIINREFSKMLDLELMFSKHEPKRKWPSELCGFGRITQGL